MSAPANPFATGIADAGSAAVNTVTSNAAVLVAMPLIWVGYRVARKVIGKVG